MELPSHPRCRVNREVISAVFLTDDPGVGNGGGAARTDVRRPRRLKCAAVPRPRPQPVGASPRRPGVDELLQGTDDLFHEADDSFPGVDGPFLRADEPVHGADDSFRGVDGPFRAADEPLPGMDDPLRWKNVRFRGADAPRHLGNRRQWAPDLHPLLRRADRLGPVPPLLFEEPQFLPGQILRQKARDMVGSLLNLDDLNIR